MSDNFDQSGFENKDVKFLKGVGHPIFFVLALVTIDYLRRAYITCVHFCL